METAMLRHISSAWRVALKAMLNLKSVCDIVPQISLHIAIRNNLKSNVLNNGGSKAVARRGTDTGRRVMSSGIYIEEIASIVFSESQAFQ